VGYSLAFSGGKGGVIGNLSWAFLRNVGARPGPWAPHIPALAHFSFQVMFAIITPALITGAFAGRVAFKSYLKFLVFWSLLVYIPMVHWIWGGGFLAQWGVLDFAGGMVVHASAGFAALASVWVVGARHLLGTIQLGVFAYLSVNAAGQNGLAAGNAAFFGKEVAAALLVAAYAFGVTWIILKVLDRFEPVRVPSTVEWAGLDTELEDQEEHASLQ